MSLYEDLGVPTNASAEDIKKAYRQKAVEHHPDKHIGKSDQDKHAEIFKIIANAFEILSDPAKRSKYDIQGYVGRRPPAPQSSPKPKPKVKTKEDFAREKAEEDRKEQQKNNTYDVEPMNINCMFYGGESTGRSILVHVKMTPQELKFGCKKSAFIKKKDVCWTCGGDGDGSFPCPKCGNNKFAKDVCGHCDTRGVLHASCPHCRGTGLGKWLIEEVHFNVSPNAQPGHSITILGQGEMAGRKLPGNVRIVLV